MGTEKPRQVGREIKIRENSLTNFTKGVITPPPRTNYGEDRRGQQASGGQACRTQRFQPEDRCQQSPSQGTVHKMFSFSIDIF